MRETHITNLLDEKHLSSLNEEEIGAVESHVAQCPECGRSYDAARLAAALIRVRASEAIEVGPFFEARVMAALKERHLKPDLPAFVRMWRAAGALASAMAVLLVMLVGVTIFTAGPDFRAQSTETAVGQSLYSPEYVVLQQGDLDDEDLAYDEVVATMYELEDPDGQ